MNLKFVRLLKVLAVIIRYGLDEIAVSGLHVPRTARLINTVFCWRRITPPRAIRLRLALEELVPIFVKLGQVLSTRPDLMPPDIVSELSLLQDRVPPFPSELAVAQITRSLGAHPDELFATFERTPVASASIAQVHFATLKDGKQVAEGLSDLLMGHPMDALAWLANRRSDLGLGLEAGSFVSLGSITPVQWVERPGAYRIEVEGLGAVEVSFA